MIIQFNTFQFYPFYDLFSYFCSILEIDVLYLVLFSIIIINIIYIIHNSSKIVKSLKRWAESSEFRFWCSGWFRFVQHR